MRKQLTWLASLATLAASLALPAAARPEAPTVPAVNQAVLLLLNSQRGPAPVKNVSPTGSRNSLWSKRRPGQPGGDGVYILGGPAVFPM